MTGEPVAADHSFSATLFSGIVICLLFPIQINLWARATGLDLALPPGSPLQK